jgi:hypothetical protein|tara:strand:+ start:1506 stop:3185 length:1680 start_codon:yes stop_codon:yes gene_type:complete
MSEVGVGKSYKPFSLGLRKEHAYNRESSGNAYDGTYAEDTAVLDPAGKRTTAITEPIEAVSGPIEEPPSLSTKNKKGQVKKHNVISENYKVLKLAEESEFSYTYSVENYKGLYHAMGGIIDYPKQFTFRNLSANFAADETLYVDDTTDYLVGVIDTVNNSTGVTTLKQFTQGEVLTGGASEAESPTLLMIKDDEVYFDPTGTLPVVDGTNPPTNATVYTGVSGAKFEISRFARVKFTHSSYTPTASAYFDVGESVSQANSSATGIVVSVNAVEIVILQTSAAANNFNHTDVVSGGTNSATFTPSTTELLSVYMHTINDNDTLLNASGGGTASGIVTADSIIYRHFIFGYKSPPHYSGFLHYESLDNQHLMTGMVCNEFGLELVTNDVPKANQTWQVARAALDSTKDTEPTNADTTLYEYTDLSSFIVNAEDYSNIFKSLSITISRDVQRFFGKSKVAKGMIQPELSFGLSVGLLREDSALVNLRLANTSFDGKIVLRRGSESQDEVIMYFNNDDLGASAQLRLLETPEGEDEGKIFHDLTFDVEGLPVFEVYDKTVNYG